MKTTKTFRQQVLSMTAGEIIMSMVKGLEKPVTKIDMDTYGQTRDGVCYGCAATNTVCKIAKVKFTQNNIDWTVDRIQVVKKSYDFFTII